LVRQGQPLAAFDLYWEALKSPRNGGEVMTHPSLVSELLELFERSFDAAVLTGDFKRVLDLIDKQKEIGCVATAAGGGQSKLTAFAFHKEAKVRMVAKQFYAAVCSLDEAIAADPYDLSLREYKERVSQGMLSRWHFSMLNDYHRNNTYKRAIEHQVQRLKQLKRAALSRNDQPPAPVNVLDIGTGSGLLAIYAHDCNSNDDDGDDEAAAAAAAAAAPPEDDVAVNVSACEMIEQVASLAEEVLIRNKKDQVVKLYECSSDELEEHGFENFSVDLAVMEVFDAGLLGEHVLPTLKDAHGRLLSKLGPVGQASKIIPCKAEIYTAPIECPYQARQYRVLPPPPDDRQKNEWSAHVPVRLGGNLTLDRIQVVSDEVEGVVGGRGEPYSCEKLESVPLGFEFLAHATRVATINFESRREIESFTSDGQDFHLDIQINKAGNLDGFALWFKLILVDEEDFDSELSTGPYSYPDCCWHQAIFPINKAAAPPSALLVGDRLKARIRIQDHVTLEYCQKVAGSMPEINGYHEYTTLLVPRIVVTELNDPILMDGFARVANQVCAHTEGSLNVLDYTNSSVLALNILALKIKSKLTLVLSQTAEDQAGGGGGADEGEVPDVESRMRFVSEIAAGNGLRTCNIDAIGFMMLSAEDASVTSSSSSSYDVVLVDPVESTGKLNEAVIKKIPLLNRHCSLTTTDEKSSSRRNNKGIGGGVFPSKVSLFCQLIECAQLHKTFFIAKGDYTCHQYEVAAVLNRVSTLHQQDMTLASHDFRPLSEPLQVHHLDLNSMDPAAAAKVQKRVKIQVTRDGCAHLLVYWFELEYGATGVRIPTFYPEDPARSFHYRQAMISLKDPVPVARKTNVEFTFLYENGLLDFVYEQPN